MTIYLTTTLHHFLQCNHAFWMAEFILLMESKPEVIAEPFQVWKFLRLPNSLFQIKLEDGNRNIIIIHHKHREVPSIYECEIWFENNVLYLPHER
ncbi:DUF6876 family protein [Kaistella pullorum]|uniref:DUF6876 family protein n=1 Tax=Kaistella pullorum TaxID=2763074 RepID=UPI003741EC30